MDQKFKRFAKTCKTFPKNKEIFKYKSKNLAKTKGEKLLLQIGSRLVSDNPMGN